MRRQFPFTISSQAIFLLLVLAGCKDRSEPDLPATPASASCLINPVASSKPTDPASIRSFEIAGVHLGMRADDALRALAKRADAKRIIAPNGDESAKSIIGRAAWLDHSWAWRFKDGALPLSGHRSNSSDNVKIATSIFPDGEERVSQIRYSVSPSIPSFTQNDQSPRSDVSKEMEKGLKIVLGTPNFQGGNCNVALANVYGSEHILSDFSALVTYSSCRVEGGTTGDHNFRCDRRRAPRRPWIGLFGGPRHFSLIIEDGEIAYATRYAPGYQASRPMLEQ